MTLCFAYLCLRGPRAAIWEIFSHCCIVRSKGSFCPDPFCFIWAWLLAGKAPTCNDRANVDFIIFKI
jgi:hypothetical protein